MTRSRMLTLIAAGVCLAATSITSYAGPPLICFPYTIGDAKSLPWGKDAFTQDKSYDRSHLVSDTIRLLENEPSTIVRMETIRRAVLYIGDSQPLARDLLSRISWNVMDYEAKGKPNAQGWFDAGFLAATLNQAGTGLGVHVGDDNHVDGIVWIKRAIQIDPDDPAKEFGAALVLHGQPDCNDHLRKAVAKAKPGSDLAKSIESNLAFGRKSLQELRAELGVDKGARAEAGKSGG
jgi:hypothetical protein